MNADAPADGPIFLIGSMGSGTSLLRLILDSHDDIAIAYETGFMRAVAAHKQIPFWKFGGDWYERIGVAEERLDEHLRRFYDGVFGEFAAAHGKHRWGDKTPFHTWHLEQAARVFPDASFVATVRHPGAVAASVHSRFNFAWPRAVSHWVRQNTELVTRGAELGDRLVLCRYEDVLLHSEPVLREILDTVGAPWQPQVLEFQETQTRRYGTGADPSGTRPGDPLDPGRITKWTASVDAAMLRTLREQTADLAEVFGYSLDDAGSLAPITPEGSSRGCTLDGAGLAARRDAFADRIDWSRRLEPTFENAPLTRQRLTAEVRRRSKSGEGARARRAERELARVKRSARYRVGSLVADAARDPARRLVPALRELAGMARRYVGRGRRRGSGTR